MTESITDARADAEIEAMVAEMKAVMADPEAKRYIKERIAEAGFVSPYSRYSNEELAAAISTPLGELLRQRAS